MAIELPFEMEFILSLTYRCNLNCSMCTQYGDGFKQNAPADMSVEQWGNFFETVSDVSPKPKMLLMGGEPLLYKDFEKLFALTQKHGFSVQIVTNGVLLDKYLPQIAGTDATITISLDGLENTHDSIRNKKGTFKKVLENIDRIEQYQKSGSKIELCINCVMLPDNVDELSDFLKFIQQKNIKTLTFQHLQFSSAELNKLTDSQWRQRLGNNYAGGLIPPKQYKIDKNYVDRLINAIEKLKNICTTTAFVFPALEDEEIENYYLDKELDSIRAGRICTTPWVNPTIHSNGDVSNCIGNIIGNINQEDFWTIWNNEKANNLRHALCRYGKFTICSKCCNFYKGNFIYAPDSLLQINGKLLSLPDEINYIKSSKNGVFILDKFREKTLNSATPVIPVETFSPASVRNLQNTETIIATFSELKGA